MFEDDKIETSIEDSLKKLRQKTELFADLSLECYELQRLEATQIALSCIVASRSVNEIKPSWNPKFRHILNYTQEEVMIGVDILLKKYQDFFGQKIPSVENIEFHDIMQQTFQSTQFPSSTKNQTSVKQTISSILKEKGKKRQKKI